MINLYCIYDRLAEKAGPLFHADNDAVAIRGYNRLVEKGDIDTDDYQLCRIGEYNEATMEIQPCLPYVIEVAVISQSQLPDDVKRDLGRTCINCEKHYYEHNSDLKKDVLMCGKNERSVSEDSSCDDWRCK